MMNYNLLDHLEVITGEDDGKWRDMLIKDGVIDEIGVENANKLNLMVGAFTSSLVETMCEEEMNVNEVLTRFKQLNEKGETQAMYYLLYLVFAALEMNLPYLFLAIGEDEAVLARYMDEFTEDYEDCLNDL
jgi:hypothetical protein